MSLSRYYYQGPLEEGDTIRLCAKEQEHLTKVMRTSVGERAEVFNGEGFLAVATLITSGKLLLGQVQYQRAPPFAAIIVQAIPKANKLDYLVEKATELGMKELWLFAGRKSEKTGLSDHLLQRLHAIAIAASKQCGRLWLPGILSKPPLLEWQELAHSAYFGSLRCSAPPFLDLWKKEDPILFFIGPESGFSQEEEEHLETLGAQAAKLHYNTLRTETASLALLSTLASEAVKTR